jgi:hypothetical protein
VNKEAAHFVPLTTDSQHQADEAMTATREVLMADSATTPPKWGATELMPLPARFNAAVRDLVAQRHSATGRPWAQSVFAHELELFDRADAEAIEQDALDSGYRFEYSATSSLESEPHKYKRPDAPAPSTEPAADFVDGKQLVGHGDNVIRKSAPLSGPVALISTIEQVMGYLNDGVPEGTIAVIDDSGGTLTAPIIEFFAGVICLGGTVRSHLGILAREYDVPTLMNCKIDKLADGDIVEIEVMVAPPAADAYESGDTGHARIWKLEDER